METYENRASGPTQVHAFREGPRITAIETMIPHDVMPGLLMLRIHTDRRDANQRPLVGNGETYYIPSAAAAVIHDFFAARLLGSNATAVESHWNFLYDRCCAFGGMGAEMRALSAVDLALWDICGQTMGEPIWRLLGGPVRDAIPVYNSCGGPFYGRSNRSQPTASGWPGHGDPGKQGALEDNWSSIHEPAKLAEELIELGYRGMKLWSFDAIFRRSGGAYLSRKEIDEGLAPFRAIRDHVGDKIELILDGHGFFSMAAACRIAEAMKEIRPLWLEDILRPDSIASMGVFRSRVDVPIAVSEMLITSEQYQMAIDVQGADYIMIDPTWVGGITATRRIASYAQSKNIPVLMHDCTGPLTLFAGMQITASTSSVVMQETVRAHLATLYPHLVDDSVWVNQGTLPLPKRSGIGIAWLSELFDPTHPGYRRSDL